MTRSTLIAFALVAAAVAAAVLLLVTGGASDHGAADEAGDLEISSGAAVPRQLSIVDIRSAAVRVEGDDLVLDAEMDGAIPERLPKQALTWRWELYEGGQLTWLVSASVDLGPNVSLVATQAGYQASTVDDTLPGAITLDGKELTVRLDRTRIDDLPASFDWLLKTTLDGDRTRATSAVAEDRAPDDGFARVDGE